MAIPEEDRGPAWLRDYGGIEADISKMEEFATKLDAEVRDNYVPHADYVWDYMGTELPAPAQEFAELADFLVEHNKVVVDATSYVHYYANATGGFADAAAKVSEQYRQSDAFAQARLRDVEAAFKDTTVANTPPTGTTSTPEAPTGSEAS